MPANIKNETFKQPKDPQMKLWRYMDFTKFVSMLSSKSLFFGKSNCFEDKFEGSLPAYNAIKKFQEASDPIQQQNAFNYSSWLKNVSKDLRESIFINCWHANEHESAAMWSLYAKTNEAVAIQTDYSALTNVLPDDSFIGMVNYIDYNREAIPEEKLFSLIMHKRISFEHEKEVRSVIWKNELFVPKKNDLAGLNIEIDLNTLIKGIYVSPTAPHWFYETVKDVAQKYEISSPIYKSDLYSDPFL